MDLDLVHVLGGVVDKALDSCSLGVFRGRPRIHGLKPMVKAFLLMSFGDLLSELDLVRYLKRNPMVLKSLGFYYLPHRTTFHRFRKTHGFLLEKINEQLRQQLPQNKIYGIDGTLEWKNDPDACWGKSPSNGWVNGFKFHILSDLKIGISLMFEVTQANKHDGPLLPKLVVGIGLGYYIADSGYDSERNHQKIASEQGFPAICRNKRRGDRKHKTLRNQLQKNKKRKKLLKYRWKVESVNELYKSILKLPQKFIKGLKNIVFYTQLTLLRILIQAVWAYNIGKPELARVTTLFKHRRYLCTPLSFC